jgi:hypothetical protein
MDLPKRPIAIIFFIFNKRIDRCSHSFVSLLQRAA